MGRWSDDGATYYTLIERWNGTAWKTQTSPSPGGNYNELSGVAATSPSNAWSVGLFFGTDLKNRTLILHWDGKAWKRQPSPNPRTDNELQGVDAASASNAWAVGDASSGSDKRTLILHWNGKAWKRQPSPNPAAANELRGVAATSGSNAWAVGYVTRPAGDRTLILHWNGTSWKVQPSPTPGTDSVLLGVTALSSSDAWAVGYSISPTSGYPRTLVLHWNGKAWKRQPSPNVGSYSNMLESVAATSGSNAWAVGTHSITMNAYTLVLHWNGKAWKRQPSPEPGSQSSLFGVDSISRSTWAVGNYYDGPGHTLAIHCC